MYVRGVYMEITIADSKITTAEEVATAKASALFPPLKIGR
jgi:hypothetical protein